MYIEYDIMYIEYDVHNVHRNESEEEKTKQPGFEIRFSEFS